VTARAQSLLQSDIAAQTGATVSVACPGPSVLIVDAGDSFGCTATVDGQTRQVTVTVHDLQGHVTYSLAPPAAGPGSTTPPQNLPATPGPATPGQTLPGD
jgi:hypothetical protein